MKRLTSLASITYILIFALVVMFIILNFDYPPRARLFPMIVEAIVLLMTGWQIMIENFAFMKRFAKAGDVKFAEQAKQETKAAKKEIAKNEEKVAKDEQNRRVRYITLWLLCYITAMSLVGVEIASILFVLLFYHIVAKMKIHWNILATCVICAVVYFVFVWVLGLNLYKGLLLTPFLG